MYAYGTSVMMNCTPALDMEIAKCRDGDIAKRIVKLLNARFNASKDGLGSIEHQLEKCKRISEIRRKLLCEILEIFGVEPGEDAEVLKQLRKIADPDACTCGNPEYGFNCMCEWVKLHPGDVNYTCKFCGIYTAAKACCNKCEVSDD